MLKRATIKLGRNEAIHYCNPGINLNDIDLKDLHQKLLHINKAAKANVIHPFLDKNSKIASLRQMFSSIVITLINVENETVGFLLSPIIQEGDIIIGHAGLVVIAENPGSDLLILSGLGSIKTGYKMHGRMFATNITSTPAIVESFTRLVTGVWPSPGARLIRPPHRYGEVLNALFNGYIKKCFIEPEKLVLDTRRFVIRSSANKMGFNTDFHSISRSNNFSYLNFCHVWLDYKKQEDMVQVGLVDLKAYIKVNLILAFLKLKHIFRKDHRHGQ